MSPNMEMLLIDQQIMFMCSQQIRNGALICVVLRCLCAYIPDYSPGYMHTNTYAHKHLYIPDYSLGYMHTNT